MKRNVLVVTALMLSVATCAQKSVTEEKFTPFYSTAEAPRMENIIPAPPALTDARFYYDWAQYQWGRVAFAVLFSNIILKINYLQNIYFLCVSGCAA